MKSRWQVDANESGVTALKLRKGRRPARANSRDARAAQWRARAEKECAYFAGRLVSFDAPCDISALPRFTQAVLKFIAKIRCGEVRSYQWVARQLGKPKDRPRRRQRARAQPAADHHPVPPRGAQGRRHRRIRARCRVAREIIKSRETPCKISNFTQITCAVNRPVGELLLAFVFKLTYHFDLVPGCVCDN